MIGFHTPELPPPLNLDLAKLSGGGACPSQFYGETHDGMDVYVRYRGGMLRVYIANEHGEDALRDGDCILEADIGPPYDGAISLTQFCTQFGVTIKGSVPRETDDAAHLNSDLTGRTTFWRTHLSRITDETSRKIVETTCKTFPDGLLVEPILNDRFRFEKLSLTVPSEIKGTVVWMIDGPAELSEIDISPEIFVLAKSGQLQISMSFSTWKYPKPKFTSGGVQGLKPVEKELGQPLYVAGERDTPNDIALAYDTLSMAACFPQSDGPTRTALDNLGKGILKLLPETRLERVDLAKGETKSFLDLRLDPVIADWCHSGPNRWLSVQREERNGPWIGIRPTKR